MGHENAHAAGYAWWVATRRRDVGSGRLAGRPQPGGAPWSPHATNARPDRPIGQPRRLIDASPKRAASRAPDSRRVTQGGTDAAPRSSLRPAARRPVEGLVSSATVSRSSRGQRGRLHEIIVSSLPRPWKGCGRGPNGSGPSVGLGQRRSAGRSRRLAPSACRTPPLSLPPGAARVTRYRPLAVSSGGRRLRARSFLPMSPPPNWLRRSLGSMPNFCSRPASRSVST